MTVDTKHKTYKFRAIGTIYMGRRTENNLRKYVNGNVFASNKRLDRHPAYRNKVVRVDDDTEVTDPMENDENAHLSPENQMDELEMIDETAQTRDYYQMTVKQLKVIAKNKQLDLANVTNKDELISLILAADNEE